VPGRGKVLSARETANTATIEVKSDGQCFLVMSVTPHKYWRITIDGQQTPAIVTNIGYQGIIVTPGRHTVVMQYRNELVRAGLLVSVVAILLLSILAIVSRGRVTTSLPESVEEPVDAAARP